MRRFKGSIVQPKNGSSVSAVSRNVRKLSILAMVVANAEQLKLLKLCFVPKPIKISGLCPLNDIQLRFLGSKVQDNHAPSRRRINVTLGGK
jgi:hypothetical protein